MNSVNITDQQIENLLSMAKYIVNPTARQKTELKHARLNYSIRAKDTDDVFELFLRQSIKISDSFTCGLKWIPPSGDELILVRYNGSSHEHTNFFERNVISYACHIHMAKARYINAGKKDEGYAEETNRYSTLQGALLCVLEDCNITGLDRAKTLTLFS